MSVSVHTHNCVYVCNWDVHILLLLVLDDFDFNKGSNDDNDINHMQHDVTITSLIMTVTE